MDINNIINIECLYRFDNSKIEHYEYNDIIKKYNQEYILIHFPICYTKSDDDFFCN